MTEHEIPRDIINGRVYHKPDGKPYAHGSTLAAMEWAAHKKYDGMDWDRRVSKDGVGFWCHQANPTKRDAWFDPEGHIKDTHAIERLTAAQVRRLLYKNPDDGKLYAIMDDRTALKRFKALGLIPCVEDKTYKGFTVGHWERFKALADEIGVVPIVMSLPGTKSVPGTRKLKAAHDAGLVTMWLWRKGSVVPDFVDLVKSKPKRPIHRVSNRPISNGPVKPPTPRPDPKPEPAVDSVATITKFARKYVGFREGRNNLNPFAGQVGFANNQAWCASFVCAVFKEAGLLSLIETPSPGVDQLSVGFKRAKRWSEYPALGAVVFYGRPSDLNHTGIVIGYDANAVTTIEGNTNDNGSREGNGVYVKTRLRRSSNLIGYGYPRFREGVTSADPAWNKGDTPTPPPPVVTPPKPDAPHVGLPANFKPDIDGIDISHWQDGPLDFGKAKAAGVKFCYHKVTEHLSMRDAKYSARRKQAKAAGIPFGGYHFARPRVSGGAAQARYFLKHATPQKGDLRPCLDLEDTGGLNRSQLQRWVEDFCKVVREGAGKPPVLYTNFDLIRDPGAYLWRARYNNDNRHPEPLDAWVQWTIWQFSNGDKGRPNHVPGIGNCDINTLRPGFDVKRLIL